MRRGIKLHVLAVLVPGIQLLGGCGSAPPVPEAPLALHDDRAQSLMKAGNFTAAAEEYLRLGQQLDASQNYPYRIYAAEAYLEAKQAERAEAILADTPIPERDSRYASWKQLLKGRIALAQNDFAGARASLAPIDIHNLPSALQAQILRNRAYAHEKLGDDLNALENYAALDPLLTDAKTQEQFRRRTWEAARRASGKGAAASGANVSPLVGGWLALAEVAQTPAADRIGHDNALRAWQDRYPGHPGQSVFADINAAPLKPEPGKHSGNDRIALLLPLTGQFANAGSAIRDGIIAAWYDENDITQAGKPKIAVYDVSTKNAVAEYKHALAEGANLIVGPLEKPAVAALMNANAITTKTIVLNQTEAGNTSAAHAPQELFEFSLPPEDEAEQVAERAWFDGHAKAFVLTPSTAWGDRIRAAFKKQFESLGGKVAGGHQYKSAEAEKSAKEPGEEGEAGSEHANVDLIGNNTPSGAGADFVFLGAFPSQGRELVRELSSRGSVVPVYATSHLYSGQPSANERELSGVVFCDMPWVVDSKHQNSRLAVTIKQTWPKAAETYGRLFALGVDAYHLLPYLSDLRSRPTARFDGETGILSVTQDGRIRRRLSWVQFSEGRPVTLDASTQP